MNITRKSLLELPKREWDRVSIYDSIIIFNSKSKHKSGYAIKFIAGCINQEPVELISSGCNSINWEFSGLKLASDMLYPSGLIRFFSIESKTKIKVGPVLFLTEIALSTIKIELIKGE